MNGASTAAYLRAEGTIAASMSRAFLERLNGWQRLWAVVAIAWLPATVWIAAEDFPNEQDRPTYESAYFERQKWNKTLSDFYSRKSPEQQSPEQKSQDIWRSVEEANRQIDKEMQSAQLAAVGKAMALWLGPMVALYLLGIAAGWIRRGFHSSP